MLQISSKFNFQAALAALFSSLAFNAQAHVTLEQNVALAGTGYKAVLRVGHGCQGSATRQIQVEIPEGFRGAKPMPKPGWALEVTRAKLAKPFLSHGKEVTDDTTSITWTARSPEHFLPDAHYDEFVLRGSLPEREAAMWFKVSQRCETGEWLWHQIPASGTSTKGLKAPAALLEILPAGKSDHQH